MGASPTTNSAPANARTKPQPQPIAILPAELAWTAAFDVTPSAGVAMDAERVYVPLQAQGVRALSRETGEPVWVEPADVTQPPLVEAGRLILALPDVIRGLDPINGETLWSRRIAAPVLTAMTGLNGVVFVSLDGGELIALRVSDGEEVWRRQLGAPSRVPMARLAPATIVVTLTDSRVVALDAQTGDVKWERSLPGTLSAPATARDRVFIGSTNNFFYALDAESGNDRWKWRTGGDVIGAAADGDRVYFASLDNVLRAVNRDNGNQLWKATIPSRPAAPPIAFGDVVVITGVAPRVDAWAGKTGAVLGTFAALADLQGVPVIDTAPKPFTVAMVALTRDGRVSALRPTRLMFPDPPLAPLLKLPGRELPRDRLVPVSTGSR